MRLVLLLSIALIAEMSLPRAGAESSWPYWDHYAARFINSQGRVIDPDRNAMTTSEGQSYALFFSLVANDPASFERIATWTEDNLAHGDLAENLPAWSWGRSSTGEWGILDSNSASDADLWIAYALVEAGRLWRQPNYSKKGWDLLSRIAQEEVADIPHLGPVLLPGKAGFHPTQDEWFLNPSYLPLPLLVAASHFSPKGPWSQMAQTLPGWLKQASPAGFAMDWVKCDAAACAPATIPTDPTGSIRGSYDAIRVYLWAGMTARETPGDTSMRETFAPMVQYMKAHSTPPEAVAADGTILSASAPASFAAALIPLLASSGEQATALKVQQNVVAQCSRSTGLLGSPARYYDQNLALFALGWQEQRFRFAPDGTLRVRWKK